MGSVPDIVVPAVNQLQATHPGLAIEIVEDTSARMLALLDDGRLDLVIGRSIVSDQPSKYTYQPLCDEPLAVVVGFDHPRFADGEVSFADLTGHRWVTYPGAMPMHALLQHLPNLPQSAWADAALHYASQPAHGLDDPEACAGEALAIGARSELAPVFALGSRAEQPVCGVVGGRVVSGQVDRLAVTADRVLIADYKTNRAPPEREDAVPVMYLRQMAAYCGVLAQLYPGREVACWLVWTDGPLVMKLPPALLDAHWPGLPIPADA